jgi:hypothetical protein
MRVLLRQRPPFGAGVASIERGTAVSHHPDGATIFYRHLDGAVRRAEPAEAGVHSGHAASIRDSRQQLRRLLLPCFG